MSNIEGNDSGTSTRSDGSKLIISLRGSPDPKAQHLLRAGVSVQASRRITVPSEGMKLSELITAISEEASRMLTGPHVDDPEELVEFLVTLSRRNPSFQRELDLARQRVIEGNSIPEQQGGHHEH